MGSYNVVSSVDQVGRRLCSFTLYLRLIAIVVHLPRLVLQHQGLDTGDNEDGGQRQCEKVQLITNPPFFFTNLWRELSEGKTSQDTGRAPAQEL